MLRLAARRSEIERVAPPLARLLGTFLRARRSMVGAANAARAGDVPATTVLTLVESGERPGLRQVRRAWRQVVPGATPPDWWCEYMAWAIAQATEGEMTPTAAQVRGYLVGVRDAAQGLVAALEAAHGDLYAAPAPDGEGGATSPTLTIAQSAGIVAAIDALVAAVDARE